MLIYILTVVLSKKGSMKTLQIVIVEVKTFFTIKKSSHSEVFNPSKNIFVHSKSLCIEKTNESFHDTV